MNQITHIKIAFDFKYMSILISFYCAPNKLQVFSNEISKQNLTYIDDHISIQVYTTAYSIQNPEFKLWHKQKQDIENILHKHKIILNVIPFDYGPIINTNIYNSQCSKNSIYVFCNNYIPTIESINKIVQYFNSTTKKNIFLCQNIHIRDTITLGESYCYATNHNMKFVSKFIQYTFKSNYEVLFNFDIWLAFYIKIHNCTLINIDIDCIMLYALQGSKNCYIHDINRQINNFNDINFSQYISTLMSDNTIKIKDNIYYQPHSKNSIANSKSLKYICNDNILRKCISIDNFYEKPLNLYKSALKQSFYFSEKYNFYISKISNTDIVNYFQLIISSILNVETESIDITNLFFGYNNYRCIFDHAAKSKWACIIFLNPNAEIDNGLFFYTNKNSVNKYSEIDKNTLNNIDNFIPEDVFGNVFNRIVLFDTNFVHSLPFYKNNIFQYIEFTM